MFRRRLAVLVATVFVTVTATATPAWAHGGGPTTLPLPLGQILYGAFFVLVISFLLLRTSWPTARLGHTAIGRPLGVAIARVVAVLAVLVRTLGLVLFAVTISAAWVGDTSSLNNIANVMIYVLLWLGVQILSVVFGDVWAVLSPFDTIAMAASWVSRRRRPTRVVKRPPDTSLVWSHWPAALGVFDFLWLELCYHSPAEPRVLARVMTAYSVVVLGISARYGRRWLRTGEAFAVLFAMLAAMAPVFRDDAGTLRVRVPFSGLATYVPRRGSMAIVYVLLGGVGFDSLQRTRWWVDVQGDAIGWDRTWVATFGLVWSVGIVATVCVAAALAAGRLRGTSDSDAVSSSFGALLPFAFGLLFAHSFALLLNESQSAIALFSNPYGKNWDLFHTADHVINFQPLRAQTVVWVQVVAVVASQVVGLALMHDRAVSDAPDARATRAQIPMVGLAVVLALAGLTVLLKV